MSGDVLALACLIVGCEEARGPGARLRAELPFAGATLIDYQARQAAAAGAKHIVLLVERMPAALTAAIDRLKRDGVPVEVARSVQDAADHIHPEERLLVIGDGVIADNDTLGRIAAAPALTMLTLADSAASQHWERIDATRRWAGLALFNGALLRRTVEMLGEWDLQSTLLRRAVQAGAAGIDGEAGAVAPLLFIIEDEPTGQAIERALAERVILDSPGWPDASLFSPVARLLAPEALMRGVGGAWLRGGGLLLSALALPFALFGWFLGAALMLIFGAAVDSIGRHADALGLRHGKRETWWMRGRMALLAVALAIVPVRLIGDGGGWGHGVVAGAVAGAMLALTLHGLGQRPGTAARAPRWIADADALVILFAAWVLFGQPGPGLGAIALYAFVSLIAVLWSAISAKTMIAEV